MDNNCLIILIMFYTHLNASQYDNTLRLPYLYISNSDLFFALYFSNLILHRISLETFF